MTYINRGKVIEALNLTETALITYPNNQALVTNAAGFCLLIGNILKNKKAFIEAEKYYCKALQINPNYNDAYNNLEELFIKQKQYSQAEKHYQKALTINPNYADTEWNLSLLQLTLTAFSQGWKNYESRYCPNKHERRSIGTILPALSVSQYQNGNLIDKHLLITPEQGIGDEIMFASVVPELQGQGAHITLACDPRLVNLFKEHANK